MKRTVVVILLLTPLYLIANPFNDMNGVQSLRESKKSMAAPDIPGNFVVDFGFNFLTDNADEMDKKFWGSKSVALSYTYNITPKNTFFSINTGIGLGLEKLALEDRITLTTVADDELGTVAAIDTLDADLDVSKSKIVANYIEIPLEVRFYTNPKDKEKGVFFSIGASAGLLYQSFTKLKFKDEGVKNKIKNNTDFKLSSFRTRGIARFGFKGVNFFYKLALTELFESNKGPSGAPTKMHTIGFSFVGF